MSTCYPQLQCLRSRSLPLARLLVPLFASILSAGASAGQTTTPLFELTAGAFANSHVFSIDGSPATV